MAYSLTVPATTVGVADWVAIIKAVEQYLLPFIAAVATAFATGNWLALLPLVGSELIPFLVAVAQALGIIP